MRLAVSLLFDQPMNQYAIIPSIGGFEVETMDGKCYPFDFYESAGGVDPDNPNIVEWMLRDEDLETFPEIKELQTKLPLITKINECYLDMEGLNCSTDDYPKPINILNFEFLVNDANATTVALSDAICQAYRF